MLNSRLRFGRCCVAIIFGICLFGSDLRADPVLFYNGDFSGNANDSLVNGQNTSSGISGLVYNEFKVASGAVWTVSAVYSNDLVRNSLSSSAYANVVWDIRTGMSAGNAGTEVAGATTVAFTTAPTGYQDAQFTESTFTATGLHVVLNSGTYYLAVAPTYAGSGMSDVFASATTGTSALGTFDNRSFWNSTFFGATYTPTSDPSVNGAATGFSLGLIGTQVVPEPSSLLLLALGASILGRAGYSYQRKRRADTTDDRP